MMETNRIIAALQIEDNEVRLVVGQFYRDRFDVIAKEAVACRGLDGIRIIDEAKAVESIRTALNNISARISAPLKSVLLVVPGHRYKREKRTFETLLEEHMITSPNVRSIRREAYKANVGSDYEIINVIFASYRINGITYPKLPAKEKGDLLTCDMDLICGDRMTLYDYVKAVSKAGVKIINIAQSGYCASKEAALFEQSFNSYVINIYLSGAETVYSLICNGRLAAGFTANTGYNTLIKPIQDKYDLSYRDAARLLFRYGIMGEANGEDRLINRWKNGTEERSITYQQLQECLFPAAEKLINDIYTYCSKIVQYDNVTILVSGQGAGLQDLDSCLTKRFGRIVSAYCPDMLGVREPKWAALLGVFYEFRDMQAIEESSESSVDMNVYRENLLPKEAEMEKTISSRFKSITDKLFVDK